MEKQEFLTLLQALPAWATEDTLRDIVNDQTQDLNKNLNAVNQVVKKLGMDDIVIDVNKVALKKQERSDKFKQTMDKVSREFERGVAGMGRATDPLAGFSELADFAGKGMGATAKGIDKVTDYLGRHVKAVGNVVGQGGAYLGRGIQGMAAVSGALAPLMMEQEKNVRQMIDFGLVFDDGLAGASEMRKEAAQMGMSVDEMFKSADGMRTMLTNIAPTLADGTKGFFDFTGHLAANSRNDRGFNQFGLIATAFAEQMGTTATMLYGLGEITSLGVADKKRIADTFQTTMALATGVADLTGISREQLINQAMEADNQVTIRGSLLRQGDYIRNEYGKDAVLQIDQNATFMQNLFSQMLPQLAGSNETVMANFITRLNVTENVEQSITPELQNIMAMGDEKFGQAYTTLVEDALTGKIDRTEITKRFRDLVNITKDLPFAPPVKDQDFTAFNRVVGEATVVSDSFSSATDAEIEGKIKSAGEKVDQADDSVEAVEAVKVSMRTFQDQLVPKYQHLGGLFAGAVEQVKEFQDMLIDAGILEERNVTSNYDELPPLVTGEGFEPGSSLQLSGYGGALDGDFDVNNVPSQPYIPPSISVPGTQPQVVTTQDQDIGIGDNRIVYKNQNATRNQELSDAMFTVLNNAAMITDPNMSVHIISGGQDKKGEGSRRTGSVRHDDGNAADIELHLAGKKLPINDPLFLSYVKNAFALGAKGGSADHDYMGSYRAHLDIVGTSSGGTKRWNFTPAFAQAQDEGMAMALSPDNAALAKLQKVLEENRKEDAVESKTTTPTSIAPREIQRLQNEIDKLKSENNELEQSRSRTKSAKRNRNNAKIADLAKQIAEITKSMNNEAIVADGVSP